jgi:hypothetical protein
VPALRQVRDHFDQFGVPYATAFLTAVPEPTSTFILAPIAVMLGCRRRRT